MRVFFLALGCLAAIGCSSPQVVRVKDANGAPVLGAEVTSVAFGANTGPAVTDDKGQASVPYNTQGAQWVSVAKDGYRPTRVPLPLNGPVEVTLDREPDAKK